MARGMLSTEVSCSPVRAVEHSFILHSFYLDEKHSEEQDFDIRSLRLELWPSSNSKTYATKLQHVGTRF
jgi:hypothetical protein